MTVKIYTKQVPKKGQFLSGDLIIVEKKEEKIFIALIDVAGHGPEASEIGKKIKTFVKENFAINLKKIDLVDTMKELHSYLKSLQSSSFKRGAAAILCNLNKNTGEGEILGVGDISIKYFNSFNSKEQRYIQTCPGVIGYQMRTLETKKINLSAGEVLIFHTDGIKEFFSKEHLEWKNTNVREIGEYIFKNYCKEEDDASCVVVKDYQ